MGIAEIIPGVSGGTFALILGIYQRLINALSHINSSFIKKIYKLNLREAWLGIDGSFLLFLVLGMFLAAISFSSIMALVNLYTAISGRPHGPYTVKNRNPVQGIS